VGRPPERLPAAEPPLLALVETEGASVLLATLSAPSCSILTEVSRVAATLLARELAALLSFAPKRLVAERWMRGEGAAETSSWLLSSVVTMAGVTVPAFEAAFFGRESLLAADRDG